MIKIIERNILPSDKIDGVYKFNLIHNRIKFYIIKEGISFVVEKHDEDCIIINDKTYCLCNNVYYNIKTKELIITKDNVDSCLNNINVVSKIINFQDDILEMKIEFLNKETNEDIKYLSNKVSKLEKELKEKDNCINDLETRIKMLEKELTKFNIIKNLVNIKD